MAGVVINVSTPNLNVLKARMRVATPRAMHAIAVTMARETEPYVPMRTGSLKNRVQVQGDTIIYPGPYARFLYHGKVMVDPATGSTWARLGATKVVTTRDLKMWKNAHPNATAYWYEEAKRRNLQKWIREVGRILNSDLNRP